MVVVQFYPTQSDALVAVSHGGGRIHGTTWPTTSQSNSWARGGTGRRSDGCRARGGVQASGGERRCIVALNTWSREV
jgi:hypothetical protein